MAETFRIARAAHLEALEDFRAFIKVHCAGKNGINDEVLYDLQLAVDEACTNIITHGYNDMDPGSIILDLEFARDQVLITITDFGHSFEPGNAPTPDIHAPIEERKESGFGIFFIQQSVDHMDYKVTEDGNKLILTKILK